MRRTSASRLMLAMSFLLISSRHRGGANSATRQALKQDAETIESIVVTARRRAESLQDTPVAVTALSAAALERQQIVSTTDLDKVAPNIQFHSYGTLTGNNSAAQVFIRGIGQSDATPAVDPGVGVYIDDVYMGRAVGAAMEFRDIANVQILRGPQGTLFGRNTIGGAVLLTSNEPGTDAGNSVRVGRGRRQSARSLRRLRSAAGRRLVRAPGARHAPARRLRHARVRRQGSRRRGHAHRPGRVALEAFRRVQPHAARRLHRRKTRTDRRSCSAP